MTPEQAAAYAADSDEIITAIYEEALDNEEPWALEAYEYRRRAGERPSRPSR